ASTRDSRPLKRAAGVSTGQGGRDKRCRISLQIVHLCPCTYLALGKKGRRKNTRLCYSYGLAPGFTPSLSDLQAAMSSARASRPCWEPLALSVGYSYTARNPVDDTFAYHDHFCMRPTCPWNARHPRRINHPQPLYALDSAVLINDRHRVCIRSHLTGPG